MKKYLVLFLVIAMLATMVLPAPAIADDDSSDRRIKAAGAAAVVTGTFFLGRYLYRRSQASSYYDAAQQHAEAGEWDKAVEAYQSSLEARDGYEDAEERLAEARDEAAKMFINQGDEEKEAERYEEAIDYYQQALHYQSDSIEAQDRLDTLAQDLVGVHYRRGYQYEVQNRWEEAYQEYQKAYQYNLSYEDLNDRYYRAKARVDDDLPMRALIFIVDQSGNVDLERPLLNALQSELEGVVSSDFYMLSRAQVQDTMDEQAAALSDTRDKSLAIDLGQIIGADEILIGEITDVYEGRRSPRIDINLELYQVENRDLIEEIEYTHRFDSDLGKDELNDHLSELAKELVEDYFK
ncbi:penicillin-binding protein activator LpoB [Fuchsiella alkaliacetigena]|uniref:penicillin-binding protein activator LpoB n=1 Tax=Fuchsiella alkaliacetigena TaxID=957042 RepID=UPI00200B6DC9|nr:penicillin-binding protein activator LpoB [Fuchsiella alkaliacetigena]MCK8826100.1 penicillin-binding protein activator LpoB [Fuchsiella alkaliacetigena]